MRLMYLSGLRVSLSLFLGMRQFAFGLERAVSLPLYRVGIQQGYVTWGAVSWLQHLPGPHLFFEGEEGDPAFRLSTGGYSRGSLDMLPDDARHGTPRQR